MTTIEEFFMIKDLKSKGQSIAQIAKALDKDRKTVTKWLKSSDLPSYKRSAELPSKLDPYKDYILERMNEGCVNATIILEEIIAKGYDGKITILRDFMKPHRERCIAKASSRFETPPGKQAQVDWGEFKVQKSDGSMKRIHAFVMVMGHSRYNYVEFTEDEKIDTLIGCHERAFKFFGGVPETILYDNMRTVVKHVHESGENKWNQKFLNFSRHHDFTPIRCRPYNPRGKGKVENGVKYLRRNFWPRLRVVGSVADLNQKVMLWLDTKCNARVHKGTMERPVDAFKRELLRPLNSEHFLLNVLHSRKVMNDCTVTYETNIYSVPHKYVGSRIGIKDTRNGYLELYDAVGICIATHEKSCGKHQKNYIKKHFEGIQIWSQKKVAGTAPKLIPKDSPKVEQRPLTVYDSLVSEVMS